MLNNIHSSDLAGLINQNLYLHRLEALHVVNSSGGLGSSFLSRSSLSGRSGSGSSLQRIVDAVGGHRHAGLHIDLRSRDVLTHQRVKARRDQVRAEARGLVVLNNIHSSDLAGLINQNLYLHRLEALHVVDVTSSRSSSRNGSSSGRRRRSIGGLRSLNCDAICSSSLLERISNSIGSHGHAGLHINLSGRDVLTNQIGQRFLGEDVSAKARGLAVHRRIDRGDHAVLNSNVHGELAKALDGVRIGRNLRAGSLERSIDTLGGHGHASLDVNRSTGDILTNQRIKDRGIRNQIRAEARGLVVLKHLDGDDLAGIINRNLDLHGAKAIDIVGIGGHNRLGIAGSSSSGSEDRFLITRSRRNTQRVLRIGKDLRNSTHKSAGRNSRAADGIDVIAKRIRIGSDGNELILKVRFTHLGAQTGGLLKSTDIGLGDVALGADTDSDRDRSAVALRSSGQRVADNSAGGILGLKDLVQGAALGQTFIFNLSILAARKHGVERFHLGSELLSLDRPLGHFVGHRQRDSSHKREHEETKRELKNVTHYFLTSPKLLLPVTRSISGDTTFISRMAKEHHSAGAFLP